MTAVATVVRKTPAAELRAYFNNRQIVLPDSLDWTAPEGKLARPLLQAFEEMGPEMRARTINDIERAGEMADEPGQTAIFGVTQDRDQLVVLPVSDAAAAHCGVWVRCDGVWSWKRTRPRPHWHPLLTLRTLIR